MGKLNFGDVVLLKFPFSDTKSYKRRPALIITDTIDGDIIACRITSQIYETKNDVYIHSWEKSGLKLPSVIRVHKIATLDKSLIEIVLGHIDSHLKEKVNIVFANLPE